MLSAHTAIKYATADVTSDTFPTTLENQVASALRNHSGAMIRHIVCQFNETASSPIKKVMHSVLQRSWLKFFFAHNKRDRQRNVTLRQMDVAGCFYFGVCAMTVKTLLVLLPRWWNYGPSDPSIQTKRDLLLSDTFMNDQEGLGNIARMLAYTHVEYRDQLRQFNNGDRAVPECFSSKSTSTRALVRFKKNSGAGQIVLREENRRNRFSMYQVLNSTRTLIEVRRSALWLFATPRVAASTITKMAKMCPGQSHSCFACGAVLQTMKERMTSTKMETPFDEDQAEKRKEKEKKKKKKKNKRQRTTLE